MIPLIYAASGKRDVRLPLILVVSKEEAMGTMCTFAGIGQDSGLK